jgi:hypothetical protein
MLQFVYDERMQTVMHSTRYCPTLLMAFAALLPLCARLSGVGKASKEYLVYFGTYTGKG